MGIDEEQLYFWLLSCGDYFLLAAGASEMLPGFRGAMLVHKIKPHNHEVMGTDLPLPFWRVRGLVFSLIFPTGDFVLSDFKGMNWKGMEVDAK